VSGSQPPINSEPYNPAIHGTRIDSAGVSELVDSSCEELVRDLNACAARVRFAPILASIVLLGGLIYFGSKVADEQAAMDAYSSATKVAQERSKAADDAYKSSINKKLKSKDRKKAEQQFKELEVEDKKAENTVMLAKADLDRVRSTRQGGNTWLIVLGTIGALLTFVVHRHDERVRYKQITYTLDDAVKAKFASFEQGCAMLARADRVWRVDTQQDTSDWKRNAGASALVTRSECRVGKALPAHVKSDLVPWSIRCPGLQLFMFPDHVFVFQDKRYGVLSYQALSLDSSTSNFRETGPVPSDATITAYTWRYVAKNGGPDRRFAGNSQIPIATYPQLDVRSPQGFHLRFYVSNVASAAAFINAIQSYQRPAFAGSGKAGTDQESKTGQTQTRSTSDRASKSAFETLGVSPGASKEEITAAYHRMAQQYHPDKVATLAPEFRELAENRMKEINVAYEKLQQ
jgi:hypothetical protein